MKNKILGLMLIFLFSCLGNNGIVEEGYFKDSNKNRIFTFSFESDVSIDEIKKHAKSQMNTSGSLTACYYYLKGSTFPRSGISTASNLYVANTLIEMYAERIKFAYLKNQVGSYTFVDCTEDPTNDLCIKH